MAVTACSGITVTSRRSISPAGPPRRRPPARAGSIGVAAFTVSRLPGPDQLAPGTQDPVAGLRDRERGELVTALQAAQVTGVIPGQAAQPGQGQPALVPAGAQFRAPPVDR